MKIMERPGRLNKIDLLKAVITDPQRKPASLIFRELFKLLIIHRELPIHYFTSNLYKAMIEGVENYIPAKRAEKIVPRLNDQRLKEVLDNKLYFGMYYSHFNIRVPRTVMFNHKELFYRDEATFLINDTEEFRKRLTEMFSLNPFLKSVIVKKIYASSKGADIYKITVNDTVDGGDKLSEIFRIIRDSEFIFQETIIQHPALDLLNPHSVNTLRIDTLIDSDNNTHVLSAYLRMSLIDHFVDNIGSGGCMVAIDINSGRARKYARPDFNYYGTKLFTQHPLTGTVFDGFELPFFEEVKKLVIRAADLIPGLRLIGWDVAFSESGPVIIEGNSDYGIRGNDLAYGGYLAHPVLKKVMDECGV